jgi:CRP-like cAMP-binding protein
MLATQEQQQAFTDLFRGGTRLEYRKGELIIRDGDTPSGVFFIESGLVKTYDITRYGEENLLIIRKPSELFPIIWAIAEDSWHVMYEAICDTVVYRLSRDVYVSALTSRSDLLPPMLDMMLEMYKVQSKRIMNLEYRTARERLVSFLMLLIDRFGERSNDGAITINAPLRQQDIASSINTSRETASRELTLLEKRGLIQMNKMFITIVDIEKLRAIIE